MIVVPKRKRCSRLANQEETNVGRIACQLMKDRIRVIKDTVDLKRDRMIVSILSFPQQRTKRRTENESHLHRSNIEHRSVRDWSSEERDEREDWNSLDPVDRCSRNRLHSVLCRSRRTTFNPVDVPFVLRWNVFLVHFSVWVFFPWRIPFPNRTRRSRSFPLRFHF